MSNVQYLSAESVPTLTVPMVYDYLLDRLENHTARDVARAFSAGAVWYPEANDTAHDLASGSRYMPAQCAGFLSAYSAMTSWSDNQNRAVEFVSGNGAGGVQQNKVRTIATLTGEHAACINTVRRILAGPKLSAFAHNIYAPTYSQAVTLDVHMCRYAFGRNVSYSLLKRKVRSGEYRGWSVYQVYSEAIRHIAVLDMGMPIPAAQAAFWVLERGEPK